MGRGNHRCNRAWDAMMRQIPVTPVLLLINSDANLDKPLTEHPNTTPANSVSKDTLEREVASDEIDFIHACQMSLLAGVDHNF